MGAIAANESKVRDMIKKPPYEIKLQYNLEHR
jgi:hypothetical protein